MTDTNTRPPAVAVATASVVSISTAGTVMAPASDVRRQPSARLTAQNRGAPGISPLTQRPIIVYGIAVPRSNPKLALLVRRTANIAILVALLELGQFIQTMATHAGQSDEGSERGQLATLNAIIGLALFGCAVPACGYWGAQKRDQNGLSLFCMGEGLVVVFGGCALFLAVISTQLFMQMCQSDACEDQFANFTNPRPDDKCLGEDEHTGEKVHVVRSDCSEGLGSTGFWLEMIFAAAIVVAGFQSTQNATKLREAIRNIQLRSNVEIQPAVVATTTVIGVGQAGGAGAFPQSPSMVVVAGPGASTGTLEMAPMATPVAAKARA